MTAPKQKIWPGILSLLLEKEVSLDHLSWWKNICIVVVAIFKLLVPIGIIVSMCIGIRSLHQTDLNIELANKPLVSIESVRWWQNNPNSDWFTAAFKMVNYGNKPADKQRIRNLRFLVIKLNKEMLREKVSEKVKGGQAQYFEEYLKDEENKLVLELMQILSDYFKSNPDAKKIDCEKFMASLRPEEKKLREALIYHNQLIFNVIEINNDLDEYYSKQEILIYPNQHRGIESTEQMGRSGIANVLYGDNILAVYVGIGWRGLFKNKEYSTFFLGYSKKDIESPHDFREFESWQLEN